MKYNTALLAFVSAMAFTSNASALDFKPYVGINYNATHVNAKAFQSDVDMHSYSAFVGTEYNRYFSTEVFYQNSNKWHKNISDTKVKSDFEAYGLDIYSSLPLGCDRIFSVFATTGIANYDFDNDFGNGKTKENGLGYRLGAGLQYNLTGNVAFRLLGRYIWTDKIDTADHLSEFSAGVKYTF